MFYNIKLMRYLKQHFPFADPTIPGAYVLALVVLAYFYIYSYLFSNLSMKLFFVLVSLVLQFQLLLFLGINDFSKYSYFPRCFCSPGHQSQKYKLNVNIFFSSTMDYSLTPQCIFFPFTSQKKIMPLHLCLTNHRITLF